MTINLIIILRLFLLLKQIFTSWRKVHLTVPVIHLPWSDGLGNCHHGIVTLVNGEMRLSNSFTMASWGWCLVRIWGEGGGVGLR